MASDIRPQYKPPAIRTPSLLAYLALFACCVGLIEWLLSDTTSSASSSSSALATTKASTTLKKRYLTTITTYTDDLSCPYLYTQHCDPLSVYDNELASLDSTYAQYCDAFSTTFLPYASSMSPQLSMALNQWQATAWSNVESYLAVYQHSQICSNPALYCSWIWAFATQGTNSLLPYPITQGCWSTVEQWEYGCYYSAGYSLAGQTSLTTTVIGACGPPRISEMVITTEIDKKRATAVGMLPHVLMTPMTSTALPTSTTDAANEGTTPSASSASSLTPLTLSRSDGMATTLTTTIKPWTTMVIPDSSNISSSTNLSMHKLLNSSSSQLGDTTQTNTSAGNRTSGTITPAPSVATSIKVVASTMTTVSHPTQTTFHLASNQVMVRSKFTPTSYFAALFSPPILAVFIKSYWEWIAASLKMIEPFERLQSGVDSTAQHSLLAQYLSSIMSLDAVRAIGYGRLLPIWSMVMYIMVELAAPLASASMTAKSKSTCSIDGFQRPCNPAWLIYLPLIRAVEGILICCMILILCILWSTRKLRVAVASNPSSIASLAALLNYEPLLRLLQEIDPEADDKTFNAALEGHLFRMGSHQVPPHDCYRSGIISSLAPTSNNYSCLEKAQDQTSMKFANSIHMQIAEDGAQSKNSNRKRSSRTYNILSNSALRKVAPTYLHLITTAALFSLVGGYLWDNNTDGFNEFLNSGRIAPKLIFVGLATVVDIQMKNLERVVRVTDPLRRMSLGNARPETTILLPLNGTCWSNLPRCLYLLFRYEFSQGRMLWQTIVTIVAALSDFNIIAVAGVLFVQGQVYFSFEFCVYSSLTITGCILITVLLNTFWWMRLKMIRDIPRQPDTIGAVFFYLCGSRLVDDWNSIADMRMETLDDKERDVFIKHTDRRYCFGRMIGTDNRERWCIDYERQYCEADPAVQIGVMEDATTISAPVASWALRPKSFP